MGRSNTDAWVQPGPRDLKTEEVVVDVPNKGDTVLVRALPALYSAQVSSQMKMVSVGRDQYATVDVAEMEALQFAHGVVEPKFSQEQARQIQREWGPTFKRVIEVIDRISGVDKEALESARQRFPASGESEGRPNGSDATPARDTGPDVARGAVPGAGDVGASTR